MRTEEISDRFTVIAIAVIAYAGMNISHEIVGHCGMAALLGNRCRLLSSTYIPPVKVITDFHTWKYKILVIAGCLSNFIAALTSLILLRYWRKAPTSARYFFWLFMSVNLLLASTYITVAPVIKFGDSYTLIQNLKGEFIWRLLVALTGACMVWCSFRCSRAELGKLVGPDGTAGRGVAWQLVVPAYLAGGIVIVASGLLSQLEFKWAQLEAVGQTFGLTAWLLLLPLLIPDTPVTVKHLFVVPRSIGWIVAGALVGLTFIFVLGPGIPL